MRKNFPYVGSVYLLLIKSGKIVLLKRANTGYEDGNYGLIAGHMEGNETPKEAMVREAKEEAGIILKEKDLEFTHVMYRKSIEDERIDFFFVTDKYRGKLKNNEPEKCDDIDWFSLNKLPSNTIVYIRKAIEYHIDRVHYSE